METRIIDDVNSTLENLLNKEFENNPPFDLSFAMPDKDFDPISTQRPTVNFYLYDITENAELRSNEPIVEKRSDGSTIRRQPPARVKLSYLVTAWSPATIDSQGTRTREEHIALSNILMALIKYPKIPDEVLSGELIDQEPPLPAAVILPNGLKNPAEFWSTFEGRPVKPALEYDLTFSLDYHDEVPGRMVLAKMTDYGNISSIYRFAIRPPIRNGASPDHPQFTPLTLMKIEELPIVSLDALANHGDTTITVTNLEGLNENDVLMIINGKMSEFSELGNITPNDPVIPIHMPLMFDHNKNTELKRLTPIPDAVDVKLAFVASTESNVLLVSGPDARRQKIGAVVRIDNPNKIEHCQITEISGPTVGLDPESEAVVQVGGIVSNNAGAPLTGAEVTLLNVNSVPVASAISDAEGTFKFSNLNKGKYTFKIVSQGYQPYERTIDNISSAKFEDFFFELKTI